MFANKKNCIVLTLLLFLLIEQSSCNDAEESSDYLIENDPELNGGFVEGDMLIDNENIQRNVLNYNKFRWPNNIVFFRLDQRLNKMQILHILRAMRIIESISCISFKHATLNQKEFVEISRHDKSCFSEVGYQGRLQRMYLADHPIGEGCFRLGTIIHELLHVLGFVHQQNVADRDKYVLVVKSNIIPENLNCFDRWEAYDTNDLGLRYDYSSILHYNPKAYSKNGKLTIIAKFAGGEQMGQRDALSVVDVKKINLAYKCPQI